MLDMGERRDPSGVRALSVLTCFKRPHGKCCICGVESGGAGAMYQTSCAWGMLPISQPQEAGLANLRLYRGTTKPARPLRPRCEADWVGQSIRGVRRSTLEICLLIASLFTLLSIPPPLLTAAIARDSALEEAQPAEIWR